jgi:uncharacterized membrane protein
MAGRSLLERRWRIFAAAVLGVAGYIVSRVEGAPIGLGALAGWNVAAAVYFATTAHLILTASDAQARANAAVEDEDAWVTSAILVSAVAAGFAGTVFAMHESKSPTGVAHIWATVLSISTLALGWLSVQSLFTLRYAHRYFAGDDGDGPDDPGVQFTGHAPCSYYDFLYMAVCIGVSGQVSDFNITTTSFRRLVTLHAGLAFFFNTAVLALGINILAGLIGQ